jgi:hypothetical protein
MIGRCSRAGPAFATLLLAGCHSWPGGSGLTVDNRQMEARAVAGEGFVHTVFVAPRSAADPGRPVFVFLEGDGRPWSRGGTRPAANPDPRRAVAYELAELQSPDACCWVDRATTAPGTRAASGLWTFGRYSGRRGQHGRGPAPRDRRLAGPADVWGLQRWRRAAL